MRTRYSCCTAGHHDQSLTLKSRSLARYLSKALDALVIFDHNKSVEPRVACQIHTSHASLADQVQEQIAIDFVPAAAQTALNECACQKVSNFDSTARRADRRSVCARERPAWSQRDGFPVQAVRLPCVQERPLRMAAFQNCDPRGSYIRHPEH